MKPYRPQFKHTFRLLSLLAWLGMAALASGAPDTVDAPASALPEPAAVFDVATLQSAGHLPLIDYFSYLEVKPGFDPQTLPRARGWKPANTLQVDNYAKQHSWLKATLHNSSDKPVTFILVQDNGQIARVALWQQSGNTMQLLHEVGSSYPFARRPVDHRYFVLPVTLQAGETREFFLDSRYATRDQIYRTIAWSEDAFFKTTHAIDLWEIFYVGIVFVMVIYNFIIFLVARETSYLFYSVFIAGAFLTFTSTSGYAFQLLWPDWPWLNFPASIFGMAIMMSFAGWFSTTFLQLQKRHPQLTRHIHILSSITLSLGVIIIFSPHETALMLLRVMTVTALPIYLLCWLAGIKTVMEQHDISYRVYLFAWTLLIVASLLTLIHEVIWPLFPVTALTMMQIVHAFEVVILSIALANRINTLSMREHVAKARVEAQSKFLARMSHEIRTPMNGIVGMSDLLLKRITDQTDKHYIEIIHSSAEALQQIINDILDYSKIEAGKLQLRRESFSIRDMIKNVCNLFELQCQEKGLQLEYNIDEAIPEYVSGDPHRIRQVMINLVGNAVKYTHKGSVRILVSQFDKNILFNVIDTGEGISAADQERLFQPFEQAASNNLGRESSTGLGLAISRELINLMQGEMGVNSEVGVGSNFWFSLHLPEAEAPQHEPDNSDDADMELPVINIMVAEDNMVNKAVIKSLLRTLGMNFVVVSNGIEAVGYFKQAHEHIDIILMDCEMPTMDGFRASEIIRNFEKEHNLFRTPIIALTAHTWHQELQQCYDSGMDELLLKPVTRNSIESLLRRYTTAVKRYRQRPADGSDSNLAGSGLPE